MKVRPAALEQAARKAQAAREHRDVLIVLALGGGMSLREVAALVDMSHQGVAKIAERAALEQARGVQR
jgi:transposase